MLSNVGTVLMMFLFGVKPNFDPYYIFWDRCQILTFLILLYFGKSTPATWGVDNGYPDIGYPTLATNKGQWLPDTGYPDTGYLPFATHFKQP
jgi:hypothetical protein